MFIFRRHRELCEYSTCDCYGRAARAREDVHREEALTLFKLDRDQHERFVYVYTRDSLVLHIFLALHRLVFNLGEYRRNVTSAYRTHDFFRTDNETAMTIRANCAKHALEDVVQWLEMGGGEVAVSCMCLLECCEHFYSEKQVFDATNSTYERRKMIEEVVVKQKRFKLFFVESICDDPNLIEQNIIEVKVSSPDYTNMNKEEALCDFRQRIEHYQEKYQPLNEINENTLSFMKIYNTGEKVTIHKHEGHIQSRIVYFLMNIHISKRTIYLTRVRGSWAHLFSLV